RFHGEDAGPQARQDFENQFKKGEIPDDITEVTLAVGAEGMPIANVLKEAGLTSSTSDAMRMIQQGAVKIDGEKVEDKSLLIKMGVEGVFQVGKRKFARISTT
ncbi:MAG TPA: tyrosine--tRNA ligase, partial [Methylophaga sp.]|nr:tyrosine--tRNA ligase [Methylophaga sp.]